MKRVAMHDLQLKLTSLKIGLWLPLRGLVCGLLLIISGVSLPLNDVHGAAPPRQRIDLERLRKTVETRREAFHETLAELATFCDERQLTLEAQEIRSLTEPTSPQVLHGENLPHHVQLAIPNDLPADEKEWRSRLRKAQQEYAQDLFMAARGALNAGQISVAMELIREVARQNPDHEQARRLLGYVRFNDQWVTPYAQLKLKQKQVWSDQYGWLPPDHVERYARGERFYNSQWMSAQKEAELRRDFSKAWLIETDHFKIRTSQSLEAGVALGQKLEEYYRIFFQTFAGFLSSKEHLSSLMTGKSTGGGAVKKYEVHYFRSKDEYIQRLQPKVEQDISITSGLYVSGDRIAYFFHDPELNEQEQLSTVYHEATHQLFSEAISNVQPVGVNSDFWIIEGIACYMESFHRDGDQFSLGNPRYIRFQNARTRVLKDSYFMPLEKFTSLGHVAYQSHPEIVKNYSQASGVVHFFMHAEEGVYRDALIAYLSDVYSRIPRVRQSPRRLDELTGATFAELNQEYLAYIVKLGEE